MVTVASVLLLASEGTVGGVASAVRRAKVISPSEKFHKRGRQRIYVDGGRTTMSRGGEKGKRNATDRAEVGMTRNGQRCGGNVQWRPTCRLREDGKMILGVAAPNDPREVEQVAQDDRNGKNKGRRESVSLFARAWNGRIRL